MKQNYTFLLKYWLTHLDYFETNQSNLINKKSKDYLFKILNKFAFIEVFHKISLYMNYLRLNFRDLSKATDKNGH